MLARLTKIEDHQKRKALLVLFYVQQIVQSMQGRTVPPTSQISPLLRLLRESCECSTIALLKSEKTYEHFFRKRPIVEQY